MAFLRRRSESALMSPPLPPPAAIEVARGGGSAGGDGDGGGDACFQAAAAECCLDAWCLPLHAGRGTREEGRIRARRTAAYHLGLGSEVFGPFTRRSYSWPLCSHCLRRHTLFSRTSLRNFAKKIRIAK